MPARNGPFAKRRRSSNGCPPRFAMINSVATKSASESNPIDRNPTTVVDPHPSVVADEKAYKTEEKPKVEKTKPRKSKIVRPCGRYWRKSKIEQMRATMPKGTFIKKKTCQPA